MQEWRREDASGDWESEFSNQEINFFFFNFKLRTQAMQMAHE